ncbi:MAG TPA: hypothetical protein VFA98_11190 [Thermoanaerobaculia bacterium]|nr:hypothetical protein [Thermoanaerobaculia bacterium]
MTVRAHKPKPIKECERFPDKKRFDLESDAAFASERSSKRESVQIYYFPCPDCGGFHLSKEKR